MHRSIEPAILYVGTPVVLVSSINPDSSANLAPISSLWFLGLHKPQRAFRQFYGRGPRLHASRLARAPEVRYAPPSVQIAAAMRAAFARR
jgi:hypothetical protein